jgi:hypothetical protein
MAATTGHSINTGPYGENTEIYSSLKLLHWLNLNCASIIGRSFTNFVFFYVDRNSKMTTTTGHSFYIGPIGFFYNQVNDTGSWEPLVCRRALIYVICVCLGIVVSNTYCVVFLFCFSSSCVHYVPNIFFWVVHFWLPLRCSLTFIYI